MDFEYEGGLMHSNVGTLFELKIPDFSHIAPNFCTQRQKTAAANAKCVN